MLKLITGVPGTGKTLYTIDLLSKEKDRPIYYHNINGLSDSLGWIELNDPFNFHLEIPDGAIVVIDEVQQVFRQRAPSKPVPDALQFLETHRHRGIDVYFITQRPKFLDHHARGLTGEHIHFHRNFGLSRSVKYQFNRYTDIDDRRELKLGTKSNFKFPANSFKLYKSAEVHTHKRKLPKKAYFLLIPLFFLPYAVYSIFNQVDSMGVPDDNVSLISDEASSPQFDRANYWQNALKPAVDGLPFTAPIYKAETKVKSIPMIKGCISNESNDKCHCYTQQGTRIQMAIAQCLHFVKNPYFDFTKEDPKPEKQRRRADQPRIRSNN